MSREKIGLKSTLNFGNFPVYAGSGVHTDSGCLFVIQPRVIYEFGRLSLKFSNQSHPNIILKAAAPIMELDLPSLVRLIVLIKHRSDELNITRAGSRQFLLVGSSTPADYASFQKPAYIRVEDEKLIFNLMFNGTQSLFEIKGNYQIEAFLVLLEQLQKSLITTTQHFDFYRNHDVGSMLAEPDNFLSKQPQE